MTNKNFWNKIDSFCIDDDKSSFPFSVRLQTENKWTYKFTFRVIQEYKKFIYLASISNKKVSPSKYIDEAWHLHLLYTKSYWEDFMSDTIGIKIHHEPSKGIEEDSKFISIFNDTIHLYEKEFKSTPPIDIWFTSEQPKTKWNKLSSLISRKKQC